MDDSGTPLDLKGYNLEFGRATVGTVTAGTLTVSEASVTSGSCTQVSAASASAGQYHNLGLLPLTFVKQFFTVSIAPVGIELGQIQMPTSAINYWQTSASTRVISVVASLDSTNAVNIASLTSFGDPILPVWSAFGYGLGTVYDADQDDNFPVVTCFVDGTYQLLESDDGFQSSVVTQGSSMYSGDAEATDFVRWWFGSIVVPI